MTDLMRTLCQRCSGATDDDAGAEVFGRCLCPTPLLPGMRAPEVGTWQFPGAQLTDDELQELLGTDKRNRPEDHHQYWQAPTYPTL